MIPDIKRVIEPILGRSYEQYNCWGLVRYVMQAGWGIRLDADPHQNLTLVSEVWWQGDQAIAVQPWDFFVFQMRHEASDHVGIAIDESCFVHTRPRIGVCLERTYRYRKHLLQIARLRQLMT